MVAPLVDNRLSVETPEGVELTLDLAGPVPRIVAGFVDLLIRGTVYVVLVIALSDAGDTGFAFLLLAFFLLEWAYPIVFEMYNHGATPGKRLLALQVLHADGTPVSWHGSILRNLLRAADFMPVGYALGIVTMAGTGRFQRLGDLAADTIVCYRHRPRSPAGDARRVGEAGAPADEAADATGTTPVLAAQSLTLEEQRAILAFDERSPQLGPGRSEELAAILEPLTRTESPREGVAFLRRLAERIVRWA